MGIIQSSKNKKLTVFDWRYFMPYFFEWKNNIGQKDKDFKSSPGSRYSRGLLKSLKEVMRQKYIFHVKTSFDRSYSSWRVSM